MKDTILGILGLLVIMFVAWFIPTLLRVDGWGKFFFVLVELKIFDYIFLTDKKEDDE